MVEKLLVSLLLWGMTRIFTWAVGYIRVVMRVVEQNDWDTSLPRDTARKKTLAAAKVYAPNIPECVHRATIEIAVLFAKFGGTWTMYNFALGCAERMEESEQDGKTKRDQVLKDFQRSYPEISETIARLLIEIAVAQVRGEQK